MPSLDYLFASLTPSPSLYLLPVSFTVAVTSVDKTKTTYSTEDTLQQKEGYSTATLLDLTPVASHFPLPR
jgi:hypothetical protein